MPQVAAKRAQEGERDAHRYCWGATRKQAARERVGSQGLPAQPTESAPTGGTNRGNNNNASRLYSSFSSLVAIARASGGGGAQPRMRPEGVAGAASAQAELDRAEVRQKPVDSAGYGAPASSTSPPRVCIQPLHCFPVFRLLSGWQAGHGRGEEGGRCQAVLHDGETLGLAESATAVGPTDYNSSVLRAGRVCS